MSPTLEILHETSDWMVINKPTGTHCTSGKTEGSLATTLLQLRPELSSLPDSGILHRLDFETTGCLMVAKTIAAYEQLVQDVRSGQSIRKTYLCISRRRIRDTHTSLYFFSRYRSSKKISVSESGSPQDRGELDIKILKAHNDYCVYQVELLGPGKRHQIRSSFAHFEAPLLGDHLYGSNDSFEGIALHAWRLQVGSLRIQCPLPTSWTPFFKV